MKKSGDMNLSMNGDCCGFTGAGIENAASKGKGEFTAKMGMLNKEAKQGALIESEANSKHSLVTGLGPLNSAADDDSLIKKF